MTQFQKEYREGNADLVLDRLHVTFYVEGRNKLFLLKREIITSYPGKTAILLSLHTHVYSSSSANV